MLFSSLTNGEMCGGWMYERALGKWASRALKQGAHLRTHQSVQLQLFHPSQTVFLCVCELYFSVFVNCICHILQLYFSDLVSCISLKQGAHRQPRQSIQLHPHRQRGSQHCHQSQHSSDGGRLELWKPCLLSKLWTRKPEKTKALPPLHMHFTVHYKNTIIDGRSTAAIDIHEMGLYPLKHRIAMLFDINM